MIVEERGQRQLQRCGTSGDTPGAASLDGEVVLEHRRQLPAKSREVRDVHGVEQTVAHRRNVEEQFAVPPDRAEVQAHEIVDRTQLRVVGRM